MHETFWTVPREWPGSTVFILGGGPSLLGFDAEILRGAGRVIAINNAYQLAPWADVLYYADRSWWHAHREAVLKVFKDKYRVSIGTSEDGTKRLRTTGPGGLEKDPSALKHGSNSGYQAIGLAYHLGAARIVLLGYDMHVEGARTHWHTGHPNWTPAAQEKALKEVFLPRFASLVDPLKAEGIEVLNATPGSSLTCFPMAALSEVLESCRVAG
jgi:hypothetical protein